MSGLRGYPDRSHRMERIEFARTQRDTLRVGSTDAFATLTGEFWDPFLDAAEERGDLRPGLDRHDVHVWLGNVGLILMSILEREEIPNPSGMRNLVRQFVVPGVPRDRRVRGRHSLVGEKRATKKVPASR